MPQLNPNPWFLIFIMSWMIYLILMYKVNNFNMFEPTAQNINKNKPQPWAWLWT